MKIFNAFFLFVVFYCGSLKVEAELSAANNDWMPKATAVDLADVRAFQDNPVIADGSSSFAVKAGLYNTILNLVGTSQGAHDKIYSDKIAPSITASQDDQGNYHYTIVAGTEETVLGYSKSLDKTKFRDVLDSSPAQDDSSQDNIVWVYLNLTNEPLPTENRPASGSLSQHPIDGLGGEYDFYVANDASSVVDQNFSGGIWVGMKEDGRPIHDSTVTGKPESASSDAIPFVGPRSEQENDSIDRTASSANEGSSGFLQDIGMGARDGAEVGSKVGFVVGFIVGAVIGGASGGFVGGAAASLTLAGFYYMVGYVIGGICGSMGGAIYGAIDVMWHLL